MEEGELARRESRILQNVLLLHEIRIRDAMTPRTVVFSLPDDLTVGEFFLTNYTQRFSRIPR
jgi:CBS domain containing-hemolysin-like protein